MEKQKSLKFIAAAAVIAITIIALVVGVFSSTNNHFVVDVIKEEATETDDFLRVTEKIVKPAGQQYFDSESLDYQVQLNNKKGANRDNRVAIVVDSSYSMQSNNGFDISKQKAVELATGIINNVANTRILVASNNGVKLGLTNNVSQITSSINSIVSGESNDCNYGLEQAFTNLGQGTNITSTIIYFTDSTDSVSDTMRAKMDTNPDLNIISVLVDFTSSAYLNLPSADPVAGEVYVLPNDVEMQDILPEGVVEYDPIKIYDELNLATNNIRVENTFADEIVNYFDIDESKITVDMGEIEITKKDGKVSGYVWTIDQIKFQRTATLKFNIKFNPRNEIDAGAIFNEISTNKIQKITYNEYNSERESILNGVDSSEGTESTVIKICQGYDLKIKAVSDSNYDLPVEGVRLKITGNVAEGDDQTELGDEVCSLEKTTDKDGYISITADEAKSLRGDGNIIYTIRVLNTDSLVGYEQTDGILFAINNNRITRKLDFDARGFEINESVIPDEKTRSVTARIPIESSKIDFEILAQEYGNSETTLSNCEFELIQPKLNNKYEMSVLSGTTDENGSLILHPTVMTKDGEYNYILRQVSSPYSYDITPMALIKIKFENGKIVPADTQSKKITTLYNENINAKLDSEKTTETKDYVVVTVEDICNEEDPFDLQINLKDGDEDIPLDGASYLIETVNSLGQVKRQYETTDSNGQINTKLYGNKYLTIKITEQTPKVGYAKNPIEKKVLIQRVDGIVTVLEANPTEAQGPDYNAGYLLNESGDQVGVKINLGSHKKPEQNVVKVILVDSEEHDVAVGRDVYYELIDDNGNSYGYNSSNRNGEISFVVGNEAQGPHMYHLVVDSATVPQEYDQSKLDSQIDIQLEFDENGYIRPESQIISPSSAIIDEGYEALTSDNKIDYTYHVKLGYYLEQGTTFKFKVKLTDQDTSSKNLDGAKYDIDIKWDVLVNGNYVTRTKTISRRYTDSAGLITTSIPKAEEVVITVKEVEPKLGYTVDTATQEIKVRTNNNGTVQVMEQTPYDLGATNTAYPNRGASVDSNGYDVTYYHQNKLRTPDETYINLSIRSYVKNTGEIANRYVNISSDVLEDGKGNKLDQTILGGSQHSSDGSTYEGEVIYNYQDFVNGNPDSYTIKVPGISAFSAQTQEIPYEMTIREKKVEGGVLVNKPNTEIKARFIFKNLGGNVKLTDVEIIAGNRLIKQRKFSSASDQLDVLDSGELAGKFGGIGIEDTLGVFIGNCILDIYTDYDEIGNFSLDLKKESVSDEPEKLENAKYDIKIINPDGTSLIKNNVIVKNGDTSDSIELEGLTVYEGSYIYLTEKEAPIGYGLNTNTETLKVDGIDQLGQISISHIDNSYNPERLSITKLPATVLENDTIKENYEVTLKDYGLDVFQFKINTIDSQTLDFAPGFNFKVTTSMGGYTATQSGVERKLGSNPPSTTVDYVITPQLPAATYYRIIPSAFTVKVVFDASGNVDETATRAAQTDRNYNTLWKINSIQQTKEGHLVLDVYVDHLDPLKVKVKTLDAITNAEVNDVMYEIPQSRILKAEGSKELNVGFTMEQGTSPTYSLNQTSLKPSDNSYKSIGGVNFSVDYTDNKITGTNIAQLTGVERQPTITKTGDKEVTINVYVEPKVPFEITNVKYFHPTDALQGANFTITEVSSGGMTQLLTDANGKAHGYNSIFERDTYKMFLVKQTKAALGFATVEDFYVKVVYSADKKIESVTLVDSNEQEVTNNKFITVGYRVGTNSEYNGNTNGIVTIEVKNYPEFKINIKNVDRRDGITPIVGTNYSVTSTFIDSANNTKNFTSASGIITDNNGLGIAHLDKTKDNLVVKYKVIENTPAVDYQSLGTEVNVLVTFDENGYVDNAVLENNQLSNIAKVEFLDKESRTSGEDNFEINLELKNNPLLKLNLRAQANDSSYYIEFNKTGLRSDELNNNLANLVNYFVAKGEKVSTTLLIKDNLNEFTTDNEIAQVTWKVKMGIDSQQLLDTLIENEKRQKQKDDLIAAGDTEAANNITFLPLPETPKTARESYEILKSNYGIDVSDASLEYKLVSLRSEFINKDSNIITVGTISNNDNVEGFRAQEDNLPIKLKVGTPLGNAGFKIIGVEQTTVLSNASNINKANKTGTPNIVYTDYNGQTTAWMDNTKENKEITYKIEMTKKPSGYEWLDSIIELKVTYDANGKISGDPVISTGSGYSRIIAVSIEDFYIDLDIYCEEIKELGIKLEAVDSINQENMVPGLVVDAYLTAIGDQSYSPDQGHQFAERSEDRNMYNSAYQYDSYNDHGPLVTGIDRNQDGTPDYTYGEDYKSMGQYITTNGVSTESRTLRLEFKNPTEGSGNQAHYMNRDNIQKSLGYYEGNVWHTGYFQSIRYNCLIDINIDDNGEILDAKLRTGKDEHIGWLCDSRYIEVTHTRYRIGIKVKLNPMFQLNVKTMDNYTQKEVPLNTLGGNISISTSRRGRNPIGDEFITRGYIGDGYGLSNNYKVYGEMYNGINVIYLPIEPSSSRILYLFEDAEPNNYQQYSARKVDITEQTHIATIEVKYDEKGSVEFYYSPDGQLGRYVNYGDTWQDIWRNDGGGYLSNSNLQQWNYQLSGFINKDWLNTKDELISGWEYKVREYTLHIGYSLTTKIQVTARDDISGDVISSIKMFPFINQTYKTNTNYVWSGSETGYRTTNEHGQAAWVYWGAAIQDSMDRYIIGSDRASSEYNGYLFPNDYAASYLGGSGNWGDYFAKLDVQYDNNGKISSVTSVGSDLWGDDNCGTITWDSATGSIYVDIIYSRKFQTKVNKVDFYDKTMRLNPAIFKVTSNKGLDTTMSAQANMNTLGKVYKNTTVKYSLSETTAPAGYYPIPETIDFYVTFDDEGNITKNRVKSTSEYFIESETTTEQSTRNKNKTKPDMTITISNKPAFNLKVRVIDKFYKNDGIPNIYLNITNSKGDQATGNPQTDASGYSNVAASPIYPNETVTYYISQTNTAPEYYINSTEVQLQVKFNSVGKVEDCKIVSGGDVVHNFNGADFWNTRKVDLNIMNMPKDIKFGIYKFDGLTNEAMENVKFQVTKKNLANGRTDTYEMVTELDGCIVATIDNFEPSNVERNIQYTIHEVETPASYRKMTDMIILATYNKDGSFKTAPVQLPDSDGFMCENCALSAASAGAIKYLDGQRVHYRFDITNDNKYDIVIKNEDTNYAGLGVEGSIFDVNVNGIQYSPEATENGITTVKNLTGTGDITINIAQRQAGEGYKTDILNTATVLLQKGSGVYTLDLDTAQDGYVDSKNATTTKAVIYVDEDHGKIYVTFTNETELFLTLLKKDIATKAVLPGAEFEVTAQQVHPTTGDNIGDEIKLTNDGKVYTIPTTPENPTDNETTGGDTTGGETTGGETTGGETTGGDTTGGETTGGETTGGETTGGDTTGGDTTDPETPTTPTEPEYTIDESLVHNKTNEYGKLRFDLGVAPQSEKWVYTFKEITPPEGYYPFEHPLQIIVEYDQYGRISKITKSETARIADYMANDNINCRNIYTEFYDKKIDPAVPDDPNLPPDYQVRVVTRDVDTKRIINNSEIQLDILDTETGDPITINPKSAGAMSNGGKALTTNIGTDYNRYTDLEVFGDRARGIEGNGAILLGRGMVYIDNINHEGDFTVQVSQTGFAEGYVPGNQKTDGTIKLHATYTQDAYGDYQVDFTSIDEDGIQIIKDKVNKVITITLYNESEMTLNIHKVVHGTSPYEPIPHVSFDVTSAIHTLINVTDTDLNTTTSATDANGRSTDPVGKAYASKTEVFTLHENDNAAYETLAEDIQIEVQYDIDGYIKNYELLTSQEYVNIETTTDRRHIDVTVRNKKKPPLYEVQVEKHKMDTIEELEAYQETLPDVTYRVKIHQEQNGEEYPADMVRITNDKGMIIDPGLIQTGFGYITVTLEELECPNGYIVNPNIYTFRFYRHEDGRLEAVSSGSTRGNGETGINYEIISIDNEKYKLGDTTKVILKPIDRQEDGKFTLSIDKYSLATKRFIENNHAKFSARLIQLDEDGILKYEDKITENRGEDFETGDDGRIEVTDLNIPTEEGNYKLVLNETQAPEGYEKIEDPIIIDLSVIKNDEGLYVFGESSSEHEKVIVKNKEQLIYARIGNGVAEDIGDNEYSLDITKVDANVVDEDGYNVPIEDMAIFKVKLPDEHNTSVYTETSQTIKGPGKLDYCFIEENKDYSVRLSHMPKPTAPTTLTYEFKEVVAPEGYGLIPEVVTMELDFGYDDDGEMAILDARSSNEEYLKILTETPAKLDKSFKVDILNREAEQSKFTIHYDDNVQDEDIQVPEDQTKEKNVNITLSDYVPQREGYDFVGWGVLPISTVPDFQPGDTFTLNQDITLYAIWEDELYLRSKEYLIGKFNQTPDGYQKGVETRYENTDEEQYISRILPYVVRWHADRTTIGQFKENLITNATTIEVLKRDGTALTDDDYIGTNMRLRLTKGSRVIEVTTVVTGDCADSAEVCTADNNADGRITKADASAISGHLARIRQLEGAYFMAADINYDGSIRKADQNGTNWLLSGVKQNGVLVDF